MNSISHQNTCVCCLERNVSLYKLSTCKYADFFQTFFKLKMEFTEYLICYHCHNLLKKMELFRQQVKESVAILSGQSVNLTPTRKINTLIRSKLEISFTTNSKPITFEIKDEPTRCSPEIKTEVKIEYETSDFGGDDVPLSVLKKEKAETREVNKSKKISPFQKKYDGKIRIIIMSNEEMMQEREKESLKEGYLNLPYKCESCIIGFDHELTLQDHIEKRHNTKNAGYVCDICKSVLSNETSYKEHAKRHVRRYECEVCGKRNNNIYSLVKHYSENHGKINTMFTCEHCGFTTESHRSYRYHKDKHKEKPQCTECGNSFVNSAGLKIHMFTVHKKSNRVYSCQICNRVYRAKSGLLSHVTGAHKQSRLAYCTPCGQHFRSVVNLRQHLRTHSRHVTDTDKRFDCKECGSKFLTKTALREHIDWIHLKNTKYECTKCSKIFKNNAALKKHNNYVHEKVRLPRNKICDHCGLRFTTLAILRTHIRTHTGERPLRCAHCPATFAHPAALYTHNKLLHKKS